MRRQPLRGPATLAHSERPDAPMDTTRRDLTPRTCQGASMTIPTLLTNYLAAKARHAEAMRLSGRAVRTAQKLARRSGGGDAAWARACTVAGVDLATTVTTRPTVTWHAPRGAAGSSGGGSAGEPFHIRVLVLGAVRCAELPRAANDSIFVAQRAQSLPRETGNNPPLPPTCPSSPPSPPPPPPFPPPPPPRDTRPPNNRC